MKCRAWESCDKPACNDVTATPVALLEAGLGQVPATGNETTGGGTTGNETTEGAATGDAATGATATGAAATGANATTGAGTFGGATTGTDDRTTIVANQPIAPSAEGVHNLGNYIYLDEGTRECPSPGSLPINSATECSNAASSLALTDSGSVSADNTTAPAGCSLAWPYQATGTSDKPFSGAVVFQPGAGGTGCLAGGQCNRVVCKVVDAQVDTR